MSTPEIAPASITHYTDGSYAREHEDWHAHDAQGKARDVLPCFSAVIKAGGGETLRVADVGAGVGGVLYYLREYLRAAHPALKLEPLAMEIAPLAVERGRALFPDLPFYQGQLAAGHGPFDAVMFVDVLEHVENPWEMLRVARAVSRHLVISQPLLGNLSTFRHNNYTNQRETWGHVSYFNYRSFLSMAAATGWRPQSLKLMGQWELHGRENHPRPWLNVLMAKFSRVWTSYLMTPFYLVGSFEHA